MAGAILPGSRVLIVARTEPRWGEIWSFCDQKGTLVVHRCRGRRGPGWLFQGDVVSTPDGVVPAARLIGRVVAVERKGRVRTLRSYTRWIGGSVQAAKRLRRAVRARR